MNETTKPYLLRNQFYHASIHAQLDPFCYACKMGFTEEELTYWAHAGPNENYLPYFCRACVKRYPFSLLSACVDESGDGEYMLRLTTGEIIQFSKAGIQGEYATLEGGEREPLNLYAYGIRPAIKNCSHNGTDVRISQIVWCEDLGR